MRMLLASAFVVAACSSSVGVDLRDPVDAAGTPDAMGMPDAGAAPDAASPMDRPTTTCVPGRVEACPCTDGRTGAQTCGPDGTFGACVCSAMDAGDAPDVVVAADVPPVDAPPATGRTYDYVITRQMIDEGAEPGVTTRGFYGFNLDGRFSPSRTASQQPADCSHGDYFSTLDGDQNMGTCNPTMVGGGPGCQGGVDNQLPNVAQTIMQFQASLNVQDTINEQINSGRLLVLIRLVGIDGALGPTLNDPAVEVLLYNFAWATFPACADIARPNQTYTVDNRSLTVPGDLSSARSRSVGRIVNGRLQVDSGVDGFTIALFGGPSTVLHETRLRFTPGEVSGEDGNLGGYIRQLDLLDSLTSMPALMMFRDAARPLIQGFVDIATGTPTATCESPDGGIGTGMGFRALRAVIAPTTVALAPTGVCGGR